MAPVAAAQRRGRPDAAAPAPVGGGPALPAGRQRAVLRRAALAAAATVEYVLYPEEYHGIQATGRIDRRIDRMTRMLDWFDRFLKA